METKNFYEKINEVKFKLQNLNLKKSGRNEYSKYDYFELQDFLPSVLELCKEQKICTHISFTKDDAMLRIIDCESEKMLIVTSPMADAQLKGCTPIQSLGAAETYQRRYLFMAAFDIVEVDLLDKGARNPEAKPASAKKEYPKSDKAWLNPKTSEWDKAIEYLRGEGTIEKIKIKYLLSKINETKLMEEEI